MQLASYEGLTHWGHDEIDGISQKTFSNAFSLMKMNEISLGFHWSLFLRFKLTIWQYWFWKMVWHQPGAKPLPEPMVISLLMSIGATRPQWVKVGYHRAKGQIVVWLSDKYTWHWTKKLTGIYIYFGLQRVIPKHLMNMILTWRLWVTYASL